MHLDNSLADGGSPEEGPEGNREVTASDSSEIEERIRNLKNSGIKILLKDK